MERLTDNVLDQAEEISKLSENIVSLSKTVTERDTTIQTLNHQLSATQNRLIHIREQEHSKSDKENEKAMIEALTKQIQDLQTQMTQKNNKSWWQVWR
jgi:septal ring factor EnvC (AmiA/AmiB activator)